MKRMLLGLALLGGAAMLMTTGCYRAPIMPPTGYIYSDIKAPLGGSLTGMKVTRKEGKAESMSVLGLFATGDASVKAAAQNGGIKTIHGADYTFYNILGVIQRFDTIVYGE